MLYGSYVGFVKTLVVRYFSFEFKSFVGRNAVKLVNIICLINGQHLEAHLSPLRNRYLLVLILTIFCMFFDHLN